MKVEKVYLLGLHQHSFRCGELAEIIGINMCIPDGKEYYTPRLAYKVKYEDDAIDYVAKEDVDNGLYEINSLKSFMKKVILK